MNGKITKRALLKEVVLLAPVAQVLSVGTKGPALNLKRLKMWNRIARCESGGRWHINTHKGYYGGLQFSLLPGAVCAVAISRPTRTRPPRPSRSP